MPDLPSNEAEPLSRHGGVGRARTAPELFAVSMARRSRRRFASSPCTDADRRPSLSAPDAAGSRIIAGMSNQPVVFWQLPPCWGLPNASPFCLKLETWLRMAGLAYVAKDIKGPPKSKSGKIPYIERPDGSLLSDSSVIIETLTREHSVKLDDGLSSTEKAQGLLIQRLFEEELYFHMLYDRWFDPAGWQITEPAYFKSLPWILRTAVVPVIRRQLIGALRGQGTARLPDEYRQKKGIADLSAVAAVLGERQFFLGRPSTVDAIAYGFLANCLWTPVRSPVVDSAREHRNLVAFCERMKETYWKDFKASAES